MNLIEQWYAPEAAIANFTIQTSQEQLPCLESHLMTYLLDYFTAF